MEGVIEAKRSRSGRRRPDPRPRWAITEQLDDPIDESLRPRGRELRRRSHEIDAASRVERPGRKHWNQRTLREITRHQPFTRAQYADALPRRIEQCKAIVRQQRPL